jgi:flavin reductase (DIM6/NTAB) family NADH-FMN oxidoreductase RutF
MLTTAHRGRADIMTMSWHMMVDFDPPLIACVVSEADYSFAALRATKECASSRCRSSIAAGNQTIFTDGIETAGSRGFPMS